MILFLYLLSCDKEEKNREKVRNQINSAPSEVLTHLAKKDPQKFADIEKAFPKKTKEEVAKDLLMSIDPSLRAREIIKALNIINDLSDIISEDRKLIAGLTITEIIAQAKEDYISHIGLFGSLSNLEKEDKLSFGEENFRIDFINIIFDKIRNLVSKGQDIPQNLKQELLTIIELLETADLRYTDNKGEETFINYLEFNFDVIKSILPEVTSSEALYNLLFVLEGDLTDLEQQIAAVIIDNTVKETLSDTLTEVMSKKEDIKKDRFGHNVETLEEEINKNEEEIKKATDISSKRALLTKIFENQKVLLEMVLSEGDKYLSESDIIDHARRFLSKDYHISNEGVPVFIYNKIAPIVSIIESYPEYRDMLIQELKYFVTKANIKEYLTEYLKEEPKEELIKALIEETYGFLLEDISNVSKSSSYSDIREDLIEIYEILAIKLSSKKGINTFQHFFIDSPELFSKEPDILRERRIKFVEKAIKSKNDSGEYKHESSLFTNKLINMIKHKESWLRLVTTFFSTGRDSKELLPKPDVNFESYSGDNKTIIDELYLKRRNTDFLVNLINPEEIKIFLEMLISNIGVEKAFSLIEKLLQNNKLSFKDLEIDNDSVLYEIIKNNIFKIPEEFREDIYLSLHKGLLLDNEDNLLFSLPRNNKKRNIYGLSLFNKIGIERSEKILEALQKLESSGQNDLIKIDFIKHLKLWISKQKEAASQ